MLSENFQSCFDGSQLLERVFYRRKMFGSPIWESVFVKKQALLNEGLFDERFKFYSDVYMWLKICEKYQIAYIKKPLLCIRSRKEAQHLFEDNLIEQGRLLEKMYIESICSFEETQRVEGEKYKK